MMWQPLVSCFKVDVRVITTEHAKHFYNPAEVPAKIYSDKDEWEVGSHMHECIHLKLKVYRLTLSTTVSLIVKDCINGRA